MSLPEPYYADPLAILYQGDALEVLAQMEPESVDLVVTSPPYYGLRSYPDTKRVWGGKGNCGHSWEADSFRVRSSDSAPGEKQKTVRGSTGRDAPIHHSTCSLCGAWRGSYGNEPVADCQRPDGELCNTCYLCHSILVLRAIRRVMKPWGTCFWVISDSWSSGSAKPYGISSKQPLSSQEHDYPSDGLCDVCRESKPLGHKQHRHDQIGLGIEPVPDSNQMHKDSVLGHQSTLGSMPPGASPPIDDATQDRIGESTLSGAQPSVSLESTHPLSSGAPLEVPASHALMGSPSLPDSSSDGARESSHTMAFLDDLPIHKQDIVSISALSEHHSQGNGVCIHCGASLPPNNTIHHTIPQGGINVKPQDLMGIPERLSLALQADRWHWRSTIIWAKAREIEDDGEWTGKGTTMPESVKGWLWERHRVKIKPEAKDSRTEAEILSGFRAHSGYTITEATKWRDCPGCFKCFANGGYVLRKGNWRPTDSYERIIMLAKGLPYFGDSEAAAEPYVSYDGRRVTTAPLAGASWEGYQGANGHERWANSGRNPRSVWEINPEPNSLWVYDYDSADYVGSDGKPYKRSANCPIHSTPPALGKRKKASYDEPSDAQLIDKGSNGDDPGQGPLSVNAAKPPYSDYSQGMPVASGLPIADNTDENRTYESGPVDAQKGDGIQDKSPGLVSMSDLLPQPDSISASQHSKQNHRKAPSLETNPACMPSAEMADGIDDIPMQPLLMDLADHIDESKTEGGYASDGMETNPLAETQSRNVRKSYTKDTCTCAISQVGHFAAFPSAIPRKIITAMTSAKGNCPKCGMPWSPVVERIQSHLSEVYTGQALHDYEAGGAQNPSDTKRRILKGQALESQVIDWRSSCRCGLSEAVPATVLDLFAGTGTTLAEAKKLGRRSVGIELSEKYCALAAERIKRQTARLL